MRRRTVLDLAVIFIVAAWLVTIFPLPVFQPRWLPGASTTETEFGTATMTRHILGGRRQPAIIPTGDSQILILNTTTGARFSP